MTDPVRALLDGAPCGLLSVDASGAVEDVNDTLLDWLSRPREEVVGARFLSLLSTADQLFFETRFVPVLELTGEVREVSLSLLGRDGPLPVLLNARRTDGEDAGVRIAVFDVTQRQDYERQLLAARRAAESSEARVRILNEAARAFDRAADEVELAEALVAMTKDAMIAAACAVQLVDATGEATVVAGEHPLTALAADPAARDEILLLRTAGVVALGSLDRVRAEYPRLADGLAEARIDGFSVVPIGGRGGILGAVMCFFRRPREFEAEDLELQVTLAAQAALVLTRIRLQDELMALALHDQLTGVANRRLLREHLIQGLATAARRDRPISLLVTDLDGFKSVNDVRGHQAGDEMIKEVAARIGAAVRGDDVVGRFGGDEFVIICHDADETAAREVAERIRRTIADTADGLPDGRPLSASVGIAVCPPDRASTPPEDFFAVADAALLRAKRDGKDRVAVDVLSGESGP